MQKSNTIFLKLGKINVENKFILNAAIKKLESFPERRITKLYGTSKRNN